MFVTRRSQNSETQLDPDLAFFFAFSNKNLLEELLFYGAGGGSGEGEGLRKDQELGFKLLSDMDTALSLR